jgi:hypothetical protein
MTLLSARARALLARAQKEATPTAQELSHLRVKLAASLANQAPDPVLLPFWLNKFAGVILAAAVGLGAWHVRGLFETRYLRAPAAPVFIASRLAPETEVRVPLAPPLVTCPQLPVEPLKARPVKPVACAPRSNADEQNDLSERRGMEHNLFSAAAAQRDPSLELQLLELAQDALDEDRKIDALGHTLRHESLYPKSAFEEERLAMQVLAWCAAGNREKAADRFERLVELSPHTAYLPRIRGTCGEAFVQGPEILEPESHDLE